MARLKETYKEKHRPSFFDDDDEFIITPETVLKNQEQVIIASENIDILKLTLGQIEGVNSIKQLGNKVSVILDEGKDSSYLNKALFDKGIIASEIGIKKSDLETNFLELVK